MNVIIFKIKNQLMEIVGKNYFDDNKENLRSFSYGAFVYLFGVSS